MMCYCNCYCFWVKVFPCIWWGLVIAGTILGALGIIGSIIKAHFNSKENILDKQNAHEKQMKDEAFDREMQWYFIKKLEEPLETELKECKEKLGALQSKEKELEEGTKNLNEEKNKFQIKLLEEKIKVYEEVINTPKK